MKNIYSLFTIPFVFLFCTSCKKTSPPTVLPPITQNGANTFGCKINGQVWVPYYPCDLGQSIELEYSIGPIYSSPDLIPLVFSMQL